MTQVPPDVKPYGVRELEPQIYRSNYAGNN